MEAARLELQHTLRHRILAGYGGALLFGAAAGAAWWTFGTALSGAGVSEALILGAILLATVRLGGIAVRTARSAFARPSLFVEDGRLVIEDPTTLEGPQAIPLDLVESVHIGPDVAGWMVGAYASRAGVNETQLGRFPQLPNTVIVLSQPVYVNQARPRLLRLWHLSAPPSPTRPTSRIWLKVDDHDAAFLVFADRGFQPAWATPENPLPVWD
jgi:hypothetical protein